MTITDLKTHILFDGWRNLVFVELETDAGITGLGEATLANRTEAVVAYLHAAKDKHVVGSDPFDTESVWRRIYLGDFIRGGMIACAGPSAIDIACHDIQGKALGVPLYKLLGGAFRETVPCYANCWYTFQPIRRGLGAAFRHQKAQGQETP
jgi:galactonate dehydratase